jgi:hypothetical protein
MNPVHRAHNSGCGQHASKTAVYQEGVHCQPVRGADAAAPATTHAAGSSVIPLHPKGPYPQQARVATIFTKHHRDWQLKLRGASLSAVMQAAGVWVQVRVCVHSWDSPALAAAGLQGNQAAHPPSPFLPYLCGQ